MIILHAGIHGAVLCLWAERPGQSRAVSGKRPGRKPKTPRPEWSPYDAGWEPLKAALEQSGIPCSAPAQKLFIWLPTVNGIPAASSPLISDPPESPESSAEPLLLPWMVTVVPFSAAESIDLLLACTDRTVLSSGIIVGRDLAFLTHILRFAAAVTARQQFLPCITEQEGTFFAKWRPVFSGLAGAGLSKLAEAMPSSCRALSLEATLPPEVPSTAVISSFMGGIVDQLVRSSALELTPPPARKSATSPKTQSFESLHDQWLHALRSSEARMEGSKSELAQFALQMEDWHRPVTVSTSSPFRLCFRLEEPEEVEPEPEGRAVWKVRYLLQAADDPSLLVPAEIAWSARGRRGSVLKRPDFDPREYLLSALGQASSLCSHIEASLRKSTPGGYDLETSEAYEFLMQKAPVLEQFGFGILLPAWWTHRGTRHKLTSRARVKSPKMQGGAGLSLEEIVHFDWEVAVGNEVLSREELEALAGLKAPLVKIRGKWVQLNSDEIQAALDFWKNKSSHEATGRQVIRMALGAQKPDSPIPLDGVKATGWIKDILSQLEGRSKFEELRTPDGFLGSLRPYQVRGFSWMSFLRRWGLGGCLADDMGLGKTIQTLALIQKDRESNGRRPVLLTCPMSVVNNWQKEAARFTPDLPIMIHHGAGRTKGKTFKKEASRHAVVITSYALLHRDFEVFSGVAWGGIILDEAQNIKNPETKQAKAARALQADYRMALTGTPVENNVGDLWSIMEFLNPGFLGTQSEFKRTFFIPIQANRDAEAASRLKRLTGPFILRRLKTDKNVITDLPDKMEMKVYCTLTKEQASLYEAVARDAVQALDATDGIQRKGVVLATLSKLKQVCNHPAQFLADNSPIPGRSGKLARLTEMIEEILEVGDRALIFSQFSEMGEIIQHYLQDTFGREVLFLHGGVPKKRRDHMVERFQAEKSGPHLFILSLKAGGTGLNLTQASHVFHFDRWWNPAVENQATDRAFRIGQKRNVQVHKFVCAGTLEERIDEMIQSKREISDHVVGTGEGWLTELSTSELKNLFALGKEAMREE
jgi:SNF2 family DNA or RNA helicase